MILSVEVKPSAHRTEVVSWKDAGTVIIRVSAPATEGKANRELITFIAGQLGVAKSLVEIKRGAGSRVKHISIPDNTNLDPLTKRPK